MERLNDGQRNGSWKALAPLHENLNPTVESAPRPALTGGVATLHLPHAAKPQIARSPEPTALVAPDDAGSLRVIDHELEGAPRR